MTDRGFVIDGLPEYARPLRADDPDFETIMDTRTLLQTIQRESRCSSECPHIVNSIAPIADYKKQNGVFSAEELRDQNTRRVLACQTGPIACGSTITCGLSGE